MEESVKELKIKLLQRIQNFRLSLDFEKFTLNIIHKVLISKIIYFHNLGVKYLNKLNLQISQKKKHVILWA